MARFDALGVVVSDLAASLPFYRLLGFDFPDPGDESHIEADLGSGLRLMLDTEDVVMGFSDWSPPTGSPRMGMALLCDSADDVDGTHAAIVAAGFDSKVDPFNAPWGQRYATVLDPDGNSVDLFAPLT